MINNSFFRMKTNESRVEERAFFALAVLNILVLIIMFFFIKRTVGIVDDTDKWDADFSRGWTYEISDADGRVRDSGTIDLPCSMKVSDDDHISFKKTIPTGFVNEKLYMETSIVRQLCCIKADGTIIYDNSDEEGAYGILKHSTLYNQAVYIPEKYYGKMLEMEFINTEGNSITMYTEVFMGSYNDLLLQNLTYRSYRNYLPVALLLFSITALISTFLLSQDRTGEEAKRFFIFSAYCISISLWFISGTVNTIQISGIIGGLKLPGMPALFFARQAFALFGLVDINKKSRVLRLVFWLVFIYSWMTVFNGWQHPLRELMIFSAIVILQGFMRVYYVFIKKSRKRRLADAGSLAFFISIIIQICMCIKEPVNAIYQTSICLGCLINIVFKMLDILYIGLRNNVQRNELEKEIYKKQTESLLERLNMHFLFNAFGVLNRSIMSGSKKASGLCMALSGWMRYTTDSFRKEDLVSIDEEIEYVRNFALLQQSRFGDAVRIDFDTENVDFKVPRLSIQPLVENAINGLRKCSETGLVRIVTRKRPDGYKIIISNDGCGYFSYIGEQALDDIISIGNRLRYMTKGTIEYINEEDGTVVTITIPEKEN